MTQLGEHQMDTKLPGVVAPLTFRIEKYDQLNE